MQCIDRMGWEAGCREHLQCEEAKTAEENRQTRAKCQTKRKEEEIRADGIELILDEARIRKLVVADLDAQIFKHRMLGKDPRFSAKRTQPRFKVPLSKMKKADKTVLLLELVQNHQKDATST